MELSEMQARAAELERHIFDLPAGSITKKTVNGKEYFCHRWTENKKRQKKYIPADELENFRAQIERRKELEQEMKALKKQLPKAKPADISAFTTNVRTGEALHSFASPVRAYRKRECFRQLHDYVYGEPQDKVFILYGLRRTGKTTMIRQIFAEMNDAELAHGIDEYIRYGGTMSLGGVHYNETSTFASKESTDEYVDTAVPTEKSGRRFFAGIKSDKLVIRQVVYKN
jgi:hypothetical protein